MRAPSASESEAVEIWTADAHCGRAECERLYHVAPDRMPLSNSTGNFGCALYDSGSISIAAIPPLAWFAAVIEA